MEISLADALRSWAQGEPNVKRAWIFGSRARGDQRDDSDLDVAVEISQEARGPRTMRGYWISEGDAMQDRLRQHFAKSFPDLEVNLDLYHRYLGKTAYAAISRDGLQPAYRRP